MTLDFRLRARHTIPSALLLSVGLHGGCSLTEESGEGVLLFAASSTAAPMRELIDAWNAREEDELQVSFGSSSTLAQHIAKGAPADLFVSANATWIQHLDARGALAVDGRVTLMRSQLVLIEPQTAPKKGFDGWERLAERLGDGRFAVGDSEHVPLGMYAKEGLTSLGVWDSVASQTTNAHNARVALAQVERGEARLGVAYAADAAASSRVDAASLMAFGGGRSVITR